MTGKQTILATLLLLLCFSLAACKDEGAQKGQMPAPPVRSEESCRERV